MTHELHASISVYLSDDPQQLAAQVAVVTSAWASMLTAIEPTKPAAKLAINETRARSNGAKRGRKPRAVAPVSEPAAAA